VKTTRRAAIQYESLPNLEVVQVAPVTRVIDISKTRQGFTSLQKWGYGLLIGSLLFSGIQAVRCGILSTNRLQGLLTQLAVIQTISNEAKVHNAVLQDKVSLYSSPLGIEEIARDRLGMVKEDEILVRLYPAALAQQ
jgi:Septum formation initiator